MKLEFAIFCDAVEVDSQGLIFMLRGGYEIIDVSSFPASVDRIYLVIRIVCEPTELKKKHTLVMQIIDPHNRILPLDKRFDFETPAYPGRPDHSNTFTMKMECRSVPFDEPGDYHFRFLVDGQQIGETSQLEIRLKGGG